MTDYIPALEMCLGLISVAACIVGAVTEAMRSHEERAKTREDILRRFQ